MMTTQFRWQNLTAQFRWQDWIVLVLGIGLFVAPYLFGLTHETAAAWTCWVFGVLLFAFADGTLIARGPAEYEFVPMVLGALLFLAPWVLGFVGVTALAWSCWIVGVLTVVLGASMFLEVMAVSVQERRRESHPVGDQATHAA